MNRITPRALLAALLSIVFLALAMVHVYWALGGQSGRLEAVPSLHGRPLFTPSPLATLLVALALVVAAAIVAGTVGWIHRPVSTRVFRVLTIVMSLVFFVRAVGDFRYVGFFKSARDTRFAYWDSLLYSPLCLGIAVAAFLVARLKR